jgi:hypothetical protein
MATWPVVQAVPPTVADGGRAFAATILDEIVNQLLRMDEGKMSAQIINDARLFAGLVRLAAVMVEAVTDGLYAADTRDMRAALIRVIGLASRRGSGASPRYTLGLHNALNTLYARVLAADSDNDSTAVVVVVREMLEHLDAVLAETNRDPEFVRALVYALVQAMADDQADDHTAALALFKNLFLHRPDEIRDFLTVRGPAGEAPVRPAEKELEALLQKDAAGVVACLRGDPVLGAALDANVVRAWGARVQAMRRGQAEAALRMQKEAHERSQRAVRVGRQHDAAVQRAGELLGAEVAKIRHEEREHFVAFRQHYYDTLNYVAIRANRMVRDLTRERALFGVDEEQNVHWMLDVVEGPARMRMRLCRNPDFDAHYAGVLADGQSALTAANRLRATRSVGEREAEATLISTLEEKAELSELREREREGLPTLIHPSTSTSPIPGEGEGEGEGHGEVGDGDDTQALPSDVSAGDGGNDEAEAGPVLQDAGSEMRLDAERADGDGGAEEGEGEGADDDEARPIVRQLEPGDTILASYNCARIEGLEAVDALLLLCKRNIYIIDGYRVAHLAGRDEIMDVQQATAAGVFSRTVPSLAENMGDGGGSGSGSASVKLGQGQGARGLGDDRGVSRCAYEGVLEVHKRRYLLRECAIEILSADGRDYLLAFAPHDRNRIYGRLTAMTSGALGHAQTSGALGLIGAGQDYFSQLWGGKTATQRWLAGEMSNFEYLMAVNAQAGRSCSDLTQYPVFPWVLRNYTAADLDLANPDNYRDLTRPMGNQTAKRAQYFLQRFRTWEDPTGETPAFHYGTHYSSAMIVASYLIRMEPFTQMFLALQGGHFDHPDRLFHSVNEAWLSASEHVCRCHHGRPLPACTCLVHALI